MSNESNWLVHDHRRYEQALDECIMAAEVDDWKDAVGLFKKFVEDIQLHMRMEDEVLYPLLDEESGDPEGEIALLSEEHDDLVRLIGDLIHVIKTKDFDHFEQSLVPLNKAMTLHNNHEEAVFLSLGSEGFLMRRDEILVRLEAVAPRSQRQDWDF